MKSLKLMPAAVLMLWVHVAAADELEDFGEQSSQFYLAPSRDAFDELQSKAEKLMPQLEAVGDVSICSLPS